MKSPSERVLDIMSRMSLEDKIGQMSQIDVSLLIEKDPNTNKVTVSEEKLSHYFGELGIGSLLNLVGDERWEAQRYREILLRIQDIRNEYDRPPVIWGLDSVHGANYINRAILTPQQLNLATSFNTTVAYNAGKLASRDTRAAGINWLFSPILGLALEPRWSRVYETFGEDPKLVSAMASALISGIQVPDDQGSVPSRAAACAKHFVGYSKPRDGHDRSPSWIPTRHLYQYFVPPWRTVAKEVKTVMESYNDYDGVPNAANHKSLSYLLRQQLGFEGVLVTDYQEILNQYSWHHITPSEEEATIYSLHEGTVDMSMIPLDPDGFRIAVQKGISSGRISMERLDRSVERVLSLKEDLGMMDEFLERGDLNLQKIGNTVDRTDALDMAHQGIILAENHDGMLPLNRSAPLKVHITGPTSNSLRYQSGGWTFQWQGVEDSDGWFDYGATVLDASNSLSDTWQVTYSCGIDILGEVCSESPQGKISSSVIDQVADLFGLGHEHPIPSIEESLGFASQSEYVVVCVGEENYAEKPGDIRSMALPDGQIELVRALSKEDAKIILVYFGGRPRLLDEMVEFADAVLLGFLPGPDAGTAIVNIMTGEVNPSGRLPITYPKYEDGGGAPYFHAVSDQCTRGTGALPHWEYIPCEVQWPFGHGLSYTSFEYSELSLNTNVLKYRAPGQTRRLKDDPDALFVSVNVKNTGSVAGSETVLFFTFDGSRHTTPEYKRLRAFEKVHLAPGEEQVVTINLSLSDPDFQSVGPHDDTHLIVQNGLGFWVGVGAHVDCRQASDSAQCSSYVVVDAADDYSSACDAACSAWEQSGCTSVYGLSPGKCWNMCTSNSSKAEGMDGWGWNYVNCVEKVAYDITQAGGDTRDLCLKMTGQCRNIFADAPTLPTGAHTGLPVIAIVLALASGLITTFFILFAMRGGLSRFDSQSRARGEHGDVQFSVVEGGFD